MEKEKKQNRVPSNSRLYKIGVDEGENSRKKRIERIEKDVTTRIQKLAQDTGANSFPSLIPSHIEAKTFIRILEMNGLCNEKEFEDIYHILVDERIQVLEETKDEIKEKVAKLKAKARGSLIAVPPGF